MARQVSLMATPRIDILLFEDNPADALLVREILEEVQSIDCSLREADRLVTGLQEMAGRPPDIILLDLNLPDSRGLASLEAVNKEAGTVPIIVMSGLDDEDLAVRAVREGAQDYLLKGRLDGDLLIRAIRYGIERQKLLVKLQEAKERIETLQGLLPICACCKDIRDDRGYWHQIEDYLRSHSFAEFTHGICPECAEKLYPELGDDRQLKKSGKE
jgi:PleD family two-component response regulator